MPYIGEIRMFAGNFPPAGWAFCNGDILSIAENETLYMILGTTYGGNGVETFGLPDLRGKVPVHAGKNNSTGTTYTTGQEGGVEEVTLMVNQIPSHTHTPLAVTKSGQHSPTANLWSTLPFTGYSNQTNSLQPMKTSNIAPVGGSQPHSNMMPSLSINFIISLYGEYPIPN